MPAIIDHSPHHPDPSPLVPTASNLILIDNYDSFTWNVYQYLVLEGAKVTVFRNDQITLEELIAKNPTQLVISPGPGHPGTDSGISRDVIKHFAGKVPVFGVCMGQQCMIDLYGGDVSFAGEILHGKTSPLSHDGKGVYAGLAQDLPVTRYHSLAGTHVTLPKCLQVTSWIANEDGSKGVIMGVRHTEYTVEGVQFHPESILSADGRRMLKNFLYMQGGTWAENERLQKAAQETKAAPKKAAPAKNNILQKIYAHRKEQSPSSTVFASHHLDVALAAEIKRGSPSKGIFALDIDAPTQARRYALAGASVISVLTEPEWFKGSIEDLRAVRQVLNGMPTARLSSEKSLFFEEYQILEARLACADTVLLIVKMLETDVLERLYKYSLSLGMEPLVEVQNSDEMTIAIKLGAKVIGVNNRNLENFEVDLGTTGRLKEMVPKDTFLLALSGINSHQDVLDCKRDGINGILVGEAIMRAPDASKFIRELCAGPEAPAPQTATNPLLVKICGTRSAEAATEAINAGADLVGMILVPGTKRCVSDETALAVSKAVHDAQTTAAGGEAIKLPQTATDFFSVSSELLRKHRPLLVGVFMNQPLEEVLEKQRLYNLDIVQLHGDEPLEWASLIPVPVIRKFKPGQIGIGVRGYHAVSLLDSGAGTGKLLDVESVKTELEKDSELQVLLAGGLEPANVAESVKALGALGQQVVGVDVSSGVEEGGKQSLERIRAFVKAAKAIR